jgi:hypothetical protein
VLVKTSYKIHSLENSTHLAAAAAYVGFFTDISGQRVGPILKDQDVRLFVVF